MKNRELPYCKCGCGNRVSKPQNIFIHNHHTKYLQCFKEMADYARNLKGRTWEEIHGEKKAKKMKRNISKVHKNKNPSKELRDLWSVQRKGSGNSFYGKHHSEETKQSISKSLEGRSLTKEHKDHVSVGLAKAYVEGRRSVNPNKHYQGEFYSCKNRKYMSYRSSYELHAYEILEGLKKVKSYEIEPFSIKYSFNGLDRHYIPDILVIYTDGSQELMEVKPRNFINKELNKVKFLAAKEFCKDKNINFSILTSKQGSTNISKVGMCKFPIYRMEG